MTEARDPEADLTPAPRAQSGPEPDFDVIARPYCMLEHLTFGSALHRARTHFFPRLTTQRNALILGDGDGRFTAALLARNPQLRVDAVDLSGSMLRLLTQRVHAAHPTASLRLHTHHANALAYTPAPNIRYDLVVTHFFLDCLTDTELDNLCRRIRPHLAPAALWLVSDFRIPGGALHLPARALIRSLYLGFRLLTGLRTTRLPNHATALGSIGLLRTEQRLSLAGLLTSELWQLPDAALHRTPTGVDFGP
jgi:SAM-dependent methyltransferase